MKNVLSDDVRVVIVYVSKTGATQQYAEWISEELGGVDAMCVDDIQEDDFFEKYDVVIFGSYVKMGKVRLQDFLIKNHVLYAHKDIFMYTVGLVPLVTREGQAAWNRVPAFIRDEIIAHEKFTGNISSDKLNIFEKIIVYLIGKKAHGRIERREIHRFVNSVKNYVDKKM